MTHLSRDVPDDVDVTREGVKTEVFQILYVIVEDLCAYQDKEGLEDDLTDQVPVIPDI